MFLNLLQYLRFLLTDFNNLFTVTIANDLRAYMNKVCHCHITLIALPHYRVKYKQVQFCEENSHYSTYFLIMRKMTLCVDRFLLILVPVCSFFAR